MDNEKIYDKIKMILKIIFVKLIKFIGIVLYSIFCIFWTLLIMYELFTVIFDAYFTNNGFDFQVKFYIICLILIAIVFWILISAKVKPLIKFSFFLILFFVQLGFIRLSVLLPSIKIIHQIEICMDTNICAEGIVKKNRKGVTFTINKDNCLKDGYYWDDTKRNCHFNKH